MDSSSTALEGLHILVVDDHEDGRDLTAFVLKTAGAIVATASTVADALQCLRRDHWDLVVTDIGMADSTGYDLLRWARIAGDRTAMVAFTAYTTPQYHRDILRAGFAAYVTKPCSPERLVEAVALAARRAGNA